MPRYRAKAAVYIDRLILPGEEFSSDMTPGRAWEPLDAEAKAKVAALKPVEASSIVPPAKPMAAIPENWREMSKHKLIALSRKLGAPASGVTVQSATDWIEREVAQRSLVPHDRSREAALQEA